MTTPAPRRASHPYYMHDCIRGQAHAIRQVLEAQAGPAEALAERIVPARRVHLVGIGTSWHASLVGEYLLRQVGKRDDARAWNSFEFCAHPPSLTKEDAVIVLSHRGTKQYSRQALELAKQAGAVTALVTGQGSAVADEAADVVLRTSYQDRSAAFTISHTTAMAALALVATKMGRQLSDAAALRKLPDAVHTALALEPQMQAAAKRYKDRNWFCFVGWGPNTATAYEAALKINEAAYAVTTAFQLEQFLHGPFVATASGCLATLIAPPGPGYQRALSTTRAVREAGASLLALVQEGDMEVSATATESVALPPVPEFLTPIVYLVPLQLLAYWLALELGRNPDVFRLDDPRHQAARQHYVL